MSLSNPAIDGLRLASPREYCTTSRSPSQSPVRRSRPFSYSADPVLRGLSPTKTLRALQTETGPGIVKSEDQLVNSLQHVSDSEKVFGITVAQTCRDLKAWCAEVESWAWPGSFDLPPESERAVTRRRLPENKELSNEHHSFWGSLPSHVVEAHEARIDDMRQTLEELSLEDIKNRVLNAHRFFTPGQHARHTIYDTSANHLDDFTALITATVLHALRYLGRLAKLLNMWTVRVLVLRKVPRFLTNLATAQRSLAEGSARIMQQYERSGRQDADVLRMCCVAAQKTIRSEIHDLGKILDSMLDDLEGHEEVLPERWIDDFESLESAYCDWIVQTERTLLEHDWAQPQEELIFELEGDDPSRASTILRASRGHGRESESRSNSVDYDQESPILGSKAFSVIRPSISGTNPGTPLVSRPNAHDPRLLDRIASERRDLAHSPDGVFARSGSVAKGRRAAESNDWPETPLRFPVSPLDAQFSSSPTQGPSPSSERSRHVPIGIDLHVTGHRGSFSIARVSNDGFSSPASNVDSHTLNSFRTRPAVLIAGSERKPSLQKTNSPVRPFEHASQAFTRLFSTSNSPSHSRSGSSSSRTSLRRMVSPLAALTERANAGSKHNRTPSLTTNMSPPPVLSPAPVEDPAFDAQKYRFATYAFEDGAKDVDQRHSFVEEHPKRAMFDGQRRDWSDKEVVDLMQEDVYEESQKHLGRHDSSFTSPDFPANWPLFDEITPPKKAINTSSFESMFLSSLPEPPAAQNKTLIKEVSPTASGAVPHVSRGGSMEPSDLAYTEARHGAMHALGLTAGLRPRRSDATELSTPLKSTFSEPTSPDSFRSNASTPEIRDARSAGYFKPVQVQTPMPLTRQPSNAARHVSSFSEPRGQSSRDRENGRQRSSLRRSGESVEGPTRDALSMADVDAGERAKRPSHMMERHASVTSIDHFSRADVKTIDVQRQSSVSSMPSEPAQLPGHSPLSPLADGALDDFPQLPSRSQSNHSLQLMDGLGISHVPRYTTQPTFLTHDMRGDTERSFEGREFGAAKPIPLALRIPKRRPITGVQAEDDYFASSSDNVDPKKRPTASTSHHRHTPSDAAKYDRHVSDVLEGLPARIRFTSAQMQASEALGARKAKSSPRSKIPTRSPVLESRHSETDRPESRLTLAPAAENTSGRADADTRLYHLTRPGKSKPIRLFVRLVGEDERVMVRVGGGWADLGEYLRQYAEHHLRRTASGAHVEVHGGGGGGGSMKVGGPKARTALSRPASVMDSPVPDFPPRKSSFGIPQSPEDLGSSSPSSPVLGSPTPNYTYRAADEMPIPAKSSSRPSTAGGDAREQWFETGDARAGASGKRAGLAQQKARWVEEMVEQAKAASAEKKRSDDKTLADVGGIRRRIFRSGHA